MGQKNPPNTWILMLLPLKLSITFPSIPWDAPWKIPGPWHPGKVRCSLENSSPWDIPYEIQGFPKNVRLLPEGIHFDLHWQTMSFSVVCLYGFPALACFFLRVLVESLNSKCRVQLLPDSLWMASKRPQDGPRGLKSRKKLAHVGTEIFRPQEGK